MPSPRWIALGIAAVVSLGCESKTTGPVAPDATRDVQASSVDEGVSVYQFRTQEDKTVPGIDAFCSTAPLPFTKVNVKLPATVWSVRTRAVDGRVVNQDAQQVGTALACAQLTDFTFPPGLQQNFYARFDLPSGAYTALGTCTLISNNVPKAGLVLAGCNLKLTKSPTGVAGGAATSLSVFNPFKLTGFSTGSYWTIRAYDQ
jgi:hypothetical protein